MSVYHGGDVWRGPSPGDVLDFSANLNPEGPPDWVRAAMREGLDAVDPTIPGIVSGIYTSTFVAHKCSPPHH